MPISIQKHTTDKIIRESLKIKLIETYKNDSHIKIIDELGVDHGTNRVDIAVVNGFIHGYEIKSDKDTLLRLPDQMTAYNSIFDKVTLVVGKTHLLEALNIIPDWWGIILAKPSEDGSVVFNTIREAYKNSEQDELSMAKLLWRNEALNILEKRNAAKGLRSKPRRFIYEKLATILDKETLGNEIRNTFLFSRPGWRADLVSL